MYIYADYIRLYEFLLRIHDIVKVWMEAIKYLVKNWKQ